MKRTFLVNFNLPFQIALKDSSLSIKNTNRYINIIWFKRNGVISRHRNTLFAKDHSQWVKDNIAHSIAIESSPEKAGKKFWIGKTGKTEDTSLVGFVEDGIYGESAFHYIYTEVFLYIQFLNNEIPEEDNFISYVVDIFNNFIRTYRNVTSDTNVSVVLIGDLEHIRLYEINNKDFDIYNQTKTGEQVILRPLNITLNWKIAEKINPSIPDFDNSYLAGIQDRIQHGVISPLWAEILLEAKEQCFKYKNYDLSIILLGTSFEVFIDFTLRIKMQAVKKSADEIMNGLKCPFLSKLKEQLPKYLGKKIDETVQEYVDWDESLYGKRNRIVHEGFKGSKEEDVTEAYEALGKLLMYIDDYTTVRGMT